VIQKVSKALVSLAPRYIKWPSEEEIINIKTEFFKVAGFPGVVGCIDGTHVKIQGPSENEPAFVNRKDYHSINVQAICDNTGMYDILIRHYILQLYT
jgi:hypothetical protein